MRKRAMSIDEAKRCISLLKGRNLKICVNKGRKKLLRYEGAVMDVYPSVFTLRIEGGTGTEKLSFSYSDFICGDITLADKAK